MIDNVKIFSVFGAEILISLAIASVKIFILAAFVFFFLKLFRVKNPGTQHLAWVMVIGGMLILPVTSYLITPPISLAVLPENLKPIVLEQTVSTDNQKLSEIFPPESKNDLKASSDKN